MATENPRSDEIVESLRGELASQTGENLTLHLSRSDVMEMVALIGSHADRIARTRETFAMASDLQRVTRARWNFERGDGPKDTGARAKLAVKDLGWTQKRPGPRQKTEPLELLLVYVALTTTPRSVLIVDRFRQAAGIDKGMTTIDGTPLKPWPAIDVICRIRDYQSPQSCRQAIIRALTHAKKMLEGATDPELIAGLRDLIGSCRLPTNQ